jgi:hypothetical protein
MTVVWLRGALMHFAASVSTTLLTALLCWQVTDQDPIGDLIQKLGSPSFRDRELATKELQQHGSYAIPALQKAAKSTNLEVAQRAASILQAIDQATVQRSLNRLQKFVKEDKVDLAIELLSRWPKGKGELACWELASDLTVKLEQAIKKGPSRVFFAEQIRQSGKSGKPIVVCVKEFNKLEKSPGESFRFIRTSQVDVIPGTPFCSDSLIFASEDVLIRSPQVCSAIFTCGSVRHIKPRMMVIVSDGDVLIEEWTAECLIIARGKVTCNNIEQCHIIAGQSVTCPKDYRQFNTIIENATKPLGFIQFFETEQIGVAAESGENGVRVTKTTEGKPFHKAGLRPGDVIASINGETLNSAEAFRKILRKHYAWEEPMTFQVVRDGKAVEIQIPRPK